MKNVFLLFLLFSFLNTHAQIYVNQDALGANDGTSWENAFVDLQTAIDNAQENDQVWVKGGTYKPAMSMSPDSNWFEINHGLELYGGFDGTETLLEERDWMVNETILDGDILDDDVAGDFLSFRTDNAAHVLRIFNDERNIIDGITVTGGQARMDDFPGNVNGGPWRGAGIEFIADKIVIRNCTVTECSGNAGGAIWGVSFNNNISQQFRIEATTVLDNNARFGCVALQLMELVEIEDCTFENNFGIDFAGGLLLGNSGASIRNCDFIGNAVTSSTVGAGMFIYQNSGSPFESPSVDVVQCNFQNNIAGLGGAILMNNFFGGSEIRIDSCQFVGNEGAYNGIGGGGAVALQNLPDNFGGGTPSLDASINNNDFEDNSGDAGGAILFYSASDTMNVDMRHNIFLDNVSSDNGGAISFESTEYMEVSFKKSVLSGNDASGLGSAVAITEGVRIQMENILVNDNLGASAIYNDGICMARGMTIVNNDVGLFQGLNGELEIQNTILSNETNYTSNSKNPIFSGGGNLSTDNTLINDFVGSDGYADYNNTDALFESDYTLKWNSAGVDGGNPTGITEETDLAGMARIQGSEIDMGAYERI